MLPFCRAQGVGVIPFFPLAGGFLTCKYKRGEPAPAGSRGETAKYVQQYMTPANYTVIERLTEWAAQFGRTPGEAAQAQKVIEGHFDQHAGEIVTPGAVSRHGNRPRSLNADGPVAPASEACKPCVSFAGLDTSGQANHYSLRADVRLMPPLQPYKKLRGIGPRTMPVELCRPRYCRGPHSPI